MERFHLGPGYYYSRLTENDKQVYQTILSHWADGGSVAKVTIPGDGFTLPSGLALHDIAISVVEDNPQLFHLETTQFEYNRHGEEVTISLEKVYSPAEYQQIYRRLIEQTGKIVAMAEKKTSDYEKLVYVHDLLANGITYDYGIPDDPVSQREIHTIVGALLNRACVCDGYARAFRLICNQLHIPCIVVGGQGTSSGSSGPHAWNYVRLDGNVYHVDVTWDSNMIAGGGSLKDYYFLRSDAVFEKTHQWKKSNFHPVIKDYPRKEANASSNGELERIICSMLKAGNNTVSIQLSSGFPGREYLAQVMKKIIDRNPRVFYRINGYSSEYHEEIQYAIIRFT